MVLSIILLVLKAIPSLKSWWDELVSLYITTQIDNIKADNLEAVKIAINQQDQRKLEMAFGNPQAGERSTIAGSQIVNSLPGVKP